MSNWTDAIVGDRMTVDREFNERVAASEFTSQEWGLIMTATEFDIEHADDPERARIVADTSKLPSVMPELERVRSQVSSMGGGGGGGGSSPSSSGGGLFDSVKSALGLGGGASDARLEAAESLVQEYADQLQAHLESKNKWEQVRTTAAES
jgi:hypothetical protein